MSSKFIPKNAVRAIYNHYELLAQACLNNSGAISITEDKKALSELSAQKLLTVLDENLEYRMNSKVRALIDYLEGHMRFRQRHGDIEEIIDDLKEAVAKYNRTYHKGDLRNTNRAYSEVRDYVGDLFDAIDEIIISFYQLIDEDYSIVSDIDEKLHQMHRCTDELGKINEIFRRLTVGSIEEEFHSDDPLINRLLYKNISTKISVSLSEITVLGEKIVKRIDKLNQEKKILERNHLIDFFAEIYADRADFTPNIDSYSLPPQFTFAAPMAICFTPELNTQNDGIPDYYRTYAAETLNEVPKTKAPPPSSINPEITDKRDRTFRLNKSIIEKQVDYFLQAVLSEQVKESLSASRGYTLLKIAMLKISLEDWMYMLIIGYQELPASVSSKIVIDPVLVNIHPTYTGNQFFKDLVFRKKTASP